jgi:hypothetical protein
MGSNWNGGNTMVRIMLLVCTKSLQFVEALVRAADLGMEKQVWVVDSSLSVDWKKAVEAFKPHIIFIDNYTTSVICPAREVDPEIRFFFRSWSADESLATKVWADSNGQEDTDIIESLSVFETSLHLRCLMRNHPAFKDQSLFA